MNRAEKKRLNGSIHPRIAWTVVFFLMIVVYGTMPIKDSLTTVAGYVIHALFVLGTILIWRRAVVWTKARIAVTLIIAIGFVVAEALILISLWTRISLVFRLNDHIPAVLAAIALVTWAVVCRNRNTITDAYTISCPECGYDLRGQTQCRCPECGSAFTVGELILKNRGTPPIGCSWKQ